METPINKENFIKKEDIQHRLNVTMDFFKEFLRNPLIFGLLYYLSTINSFVSFLRVNVPLMSDPDSFIHLFIRGVILLMVYQIIKNLF